MHPIKATLLAATLFAVHASTQATPYYIDPDSVPLATRKSWCTTQQSSCPLLCLQLKGDSSTTAANDCDAETLAYECVCGNGLSPNASEYSQTLPYFICQEYGNRCVESCAGASQCQFDCRKNNPCGAQDPTRVNVTTTSTQSATATNGAATSNADGVVYTGLGGDSEPSETAAASETSASSDNKSNGSQMALDIGHSYGLAVVFAGLFAGFALVM